MFPSPGPISSWEAGHRQPLFPQRPQLCLVCSRGSVNRCEVGPLGRYIEQLSCAAHARTEGCRGLRCISDLAAHQSLDHHRGAGKAEGPPKSTSPGPGTQPAGLSCGQAASWKLCPRGEKFTP